MMFASYRMLLNVLLPLWGARGSEFESHRPDQ